tara:strand:+ start:147 stop:425 length:279 start_codon:yes stop_codon:yes gene_type:complete
LYLLVVDMEEEVVTEDLVGLVVLLVSLLVVVEMELVILIQEIIQHHPHQMDGDIMVEDRLLVVLVQVVEEQVVLELLERIQALQEKVETVFN